ncbi:MAG: hypothetical protein Q8834_02535, partial [Candidatus Phytoplasma australasiaticum]|nr:hypothetical protein [Candidatus Phytoplasma australasiaticum]
LFDARATALIFLEMLEQLEAQKIFNFYDLQGSLDIKFERPYHLSFRLLTSCVIWHFGVC